MIPPVLLIISASSGVLWWSGEKIVKNWIEISKQSEVLDKLETKTFGVEVLEDKTGRFIVLPKGWTAKEGWKVGDKRAVKLERS